MHTYATHNAYIQRFSTTNTYLTTNNPPVISPHNKLEGAHGYCCSEVVVTLLFSVLGDDDEPVSRHPLTNKQAGRSAFIHVFFFATSVKLACSLTACVCLVRCRRRQGLYIVVVAAIERRPQAISLEVGDPSCQLSSATGSCER